MKYDEKIHWIENQNGQLKDNMNQYIRDKDSLSLEQDKPMRKSMIIEENSSKKWTLVNGKCQKKKLLKG